MVAGFAELAERKVGRLASGTPAPEQVLYSIRDSRWFKSGLRN